VDPVINVGRWIQEWGMIQPEKKALIFEETSFSYRQFSERVHRISNALLNMNIKKGDRVALLLYNCNQYLEAYFATSTIGAIAVPLNYRLALPELEYLLNDSGASTLIFHKEFLDMVEKLRPKILPKADHYVGVGDALPHWAFNYEDLVGACSPEAPRIPSEVGGEDPHLIMYTSGTTGLPKGAVLSHRKTFYNCLNADIFFELKPTDIMLIVVPLFHSAGLIITASPIYYKGGTAILHRRFDPRHVLEDIQKYRVNKFLAVTTMYNLILQKENLEKYDISSLETCVIGGERVPPSLIERYRDHGICLRQIFGQTETSILLWTTEEDAVKKTGTVGKPVPHSEIRLVDPEGRGVRVGEVGEIIARGPILMSGYWNSPELMRQTIREGWLHTGDLARTDEDGCFYIVDREKDMYISGGENVYPAEIEKIYSAHPKVFEVAVIGVPDEKWGQVGKVFIVLKEGASMTEEEVIGYCDGKVARFKIPKHCRFVDVLPKTESGKIKKTALRSIS
jgi:fatty-acyl-CoA synthase